jgi:small-conductance mechanosensitive channel
VAVIFLIARLISRAGTMFLDRISDERVTFGWLDRDTAPPTRMVFTVVVWLFALAMAYPYLPGAKSQAFQGLSVLLGLMVSIGASSTIGQAASGLILMYTRAFRVGEFVHIQGTEGTVIELGLFSTRVRTGMGEEVMLPNTMVLANTSKNYSRVVPGTGFIVDTVVTIGYDAPWRQVQAMLKEAASRVPAIAAQPEPRVFQTALSDFYVEYRLVAYSRVEDPLPRADAISRLHASIQDVFNEHGVQIMSPHYLGDPADAKIVPKGRWFEKPAVPPAT